MKNKQVNIQLSEKQIEKLNQLVAHENLTLNSKQTTSGLVRNIIDKYLNDNIIEENNKSFCLSNLPNDFLIGETNNSLIGYSGTPINKLIVICDKVNYNVNIQYEEIIIYGPKVINEKGSRIDNIQHCDVFDLAASFMYQEFNKQKYELIVQFDEKINEKGVKGCLKIKSKDFIGLCPNYYAKSTGTSYPLRIASWYDYIYNQLEFINTKDNNIYEFNNCITELKISYKKDSCIQKLKIINIDENFEDSDFDNWILSKFSTDIKSIENNLQLFDISCFPHIDSFYLNKISLLNSKPYFYLNKGQGKLIDIEINLSK